MTERFQDTRSPAGSERSAECVLTVRNRPVGFRSSRWGGELFAVERGYFPVSCTGYRSLSGAGHVEALSPADHLQEILETRSAEEDRAREGLLRQLARETPATGDPLMNYINLSSSAEKALSDGFFAPDAARPFLWGGAYRLFSRIEADRRFQPQPNGGVWTTGHCQQALERTRVFRQYLEKLARGDFSSPVPHPLRVYGAMAYFKLPPKAGGERPFALPAIEQELALDVRAATAARAAGGTLRNPAHPSVPDSARPPVAQLRLF